MNTEVYRPQYILFTRSRSLFWALAAILISFFLQGCGNPLGSSKAASDFQPGIPPAPPAVTVPAVAAPPSALGIDVSEVHAAGTTVDANLSVPDSKAVFQGTTIDATLKTGN